MCQGIQLVLDPLEVIIGVLVDGVLANDALSLLCRFGGDPFMVKFCQFLAAEDLEVLPLLQSRQISWK